MSGQCGAEDFLEHILIDACGNFAWKISSGNFGRMTNEATGVVCPGYHVGIFLALDWYWIFVCLLSVYLCQDLSAWPGLGIGFSIPE